MNKTKSILFLILIFIFTVISAFYFENSYRVVVRHFFNFFHGDKIQFIGKNFHLFASTYFVIAFGIFSVLLTFFLYAHNRAKRVIFLCLTITIFFLTTMITTYIDSSTKIFECTVCQDGIRRLHYNAVNYDFHFITSLVAGLMPLFFAFLKRQISKNDRKNLPTTLHWRYGG